jgi:hypothetical protein
VFFEIESNLKSVQFFFIHPVESDGLSISAFSVVKCMHYRASKSWLHFPRRVSRPAKIRLHQLEWTILDLSSSKEVAAWLRDTTVSLRACQHARYRIPSTQSIFCVPSVVLRRAEVSRRICTATTGRTLPEPPVY